MSFISSGYRNLENYNKAVEYCIKGLNHAIKLKNKKEIAYNYHTLSTIYLFLNNYDIALKYINKSFNLFNETNNIRGLGYCYHSFGNIYAEKSEYTLALENFNKALRIKEKNNDKNGCATIYNEIGELYFIQSNYAKALIFFNKSLDVFLDLNLSSKIGREYANIAKTHLHINNVNQAIQYANESLKIEDKLNLDEIVMTSYYVLYESYNKLKNFEKAFYYQGLFVTTKINFFNKKKNRQIYEVQTKYESQSKDLNIKILKKEKATHYIIIFSFIGFFIVSIILIIVLFKKNQNKKASNKLLENAKNELVRHAIDLEELNKRLVESESKLKESNNSKNILFSIISHDLINSINSILGFSSVLCNDYEVFDKNEIKKYLILINDSTKKLYRLIDNLLQWSRTQLDHIKYTPDFCNVKYIAEELIINSLNDFKNKNIKVRVDISEICIAFCDMDMVKVIVRNLLTNAIKFTKPGGEIIISANKRNKYIEVSVSDNGVGISKDDINKLFDDKISFTSRGTLAEKGTGLGLVICRDFVQINKGKIWVESVEDEGSVFKFTLPEIEMIN